MDGHTLRKEDAEILKAALLWNPQGNRKRGRPRNSSRRSVIKETGRSWNELRFLAADRQKWKGLIDNLCVLGKDGLLLLYYSYIQLRKQVGANTRISGTKTFKKYQNFPHHKSISDRKIKSEFISFSPPHMDYTLRSWCLADTNIFHNPFNKTKEQIRDTFYEVQQKFS
jgi:hypothetical protein